MQVLPMISALLAGLIILLSLQAVDSLSVSSSRRSEPQLFTIPLQRRVTERTDIHPLMLLQLRINRGIRRLAKMTGAEPPSEESLKQLLERRMLSLNDPSGIDRRFNRIGVQNEGDVQVEKRFNQVGVSKRNQAGVTIAKTPTASNSLGLDIDGNDEDYFGVVEIGTPPQNFSILMDSGSADFWVGSENCKEQGTEDGCGNHNFLGQNSSSSFTNLARTFTITYGSGSVSGDLVSDVVTIAGLTLNKHTFGVANVESVDFTGNKKRVVPFDGLMGLARSELSAQGVLTPVDALKKNKLIAAAIVSFKISREADVNNTGGELTFGGVDSNNVKSDTTITTPNVNVQGFWEVPLDGVDVDGQNVKLGIRSAILDTGTTLAQLPQNDVEAILAQIPGVVFDNRTDVQAFRIPCNNTAVVTVAIGGQKFPIDPRDIVIKDSDFDNTGNCFSAIIPNSVGNSTTQWLAGDVFLKNVILTLNSDNNTVSLGIPA